ncbi:MAG: penicillin acylase family protein, partial [Bryobacteraceae bacterium]
MRVSLLACALAASFAAELHPLAKKVVIRRDTYGVPHILADTEEAAAFAMGFAQAEDHAAEIARRFVAARGELARRLGAGADGDFEMKRYGNHEVARSS